MMGVKTSPSLRERRLGVGVDTGCSGVAEFEAPIVI